MLRADGKKSLTLEPKITFIFKLKTFNENGRVCSIKNCVLVGAASARFLQNKSKEPHNEDKNESASKAIKRRSVAAVSARFRSKSAGSEINK